MKPRDPQELSEGRVRENGPEHDGESAAEARRISPEGGGTRAYQAAGLCRTCRRRETCHRHGAMGGVWRCADYL